MRTNIEIEDRLMKDALTITGLTTKREVVELALKELVKLRQQSDLKKLKGKFYWEGDLEEMRLDK
jgi:Arc/MetJ family transcription regulator